MPNNPHECPLCGGEPEIEEKHSAGKGWYFICTHRCETVPKFYVEMSDDFPSRAKAVEAWNAWLSGMVKRDAVGQG